MEDLETWLERVYLKAGWKTIKNRNIFRVVNGKEHPLRENIITMYYPLTLSNLPPGDINLKGNEW